MKKLLNAILLTTLMGGVLLFSGCEKTPTSNNNGNGGGGDNSFSGVYTLAVNPLYSNMKAADQAATAIELENTKLTYATIITMAYMYLPQIEISTYPTEITFNPDGTIRIVEKDPVEGDDTIFPDEKDGLSPKDITYHIEGNNLILSLTSEAIDGIINDESKDPGFNADVKNILAKFTKGVVIYSASENTAKITLRYNLVGTKLSVYVDQALLRETYAAIQDAQDGILALIGTNNPELVSTITAILPQVDKMLKTGFTQIEVGIHLAKN